MLQGGLGLPEREYYLSADPKLAELRTAYQADIARTGEAIGEARFEIAGLNKQMMEEVATRLREVQVEDRGCGRARPAFRGPNCQPLPHQILDAGVAPKERAS